MSLVAAATRTIPTSGDSRGSHVARIASRPGTATARRHRTVPSGRVGAVSICGPQRTGPAPLGRRGPRPQTIARVDRNEVADIHDRCSGSRARRRDQPRNGCGAVGSPRQSRSPDPRHDCPERQQQGRRHYGASPSEEAGRLTRHEAQRRPDHAARTDTFRFGQQRRSWPTDRAHRRSTVVRPLGLGSLATSSAGQPAQARVPRHGLDAGTAGPATERLGSTCVRARRPRDGDSRSSRTLRRGTPSESRGRGVGRPGRLRRSASASRHRSSERAPSRCSVIATRRPRPIRPTRKGGLHRCRGLGERHLASPERVPRRIPLRLLLNARTGHEPGRRRRRVHAQFGGAACLDPLARPA